MNRNFFALTCLVLLPSTTTTVCVASVTAQNIFQFVAQGDDTSVLQFLSNHGNIDTIDSQGNSLLHIAIRDCPNDKITKFLIEHGADVNSTNKEGETPLDFALEDEESEDIVNLLLNNGADMDLLDNSGHSIYENAVYERKSNVNILKQYRESHRLQDNTNSKNNDNEKLEKLVQNSNITALELRFQQKWNANSRDNSGNTLLQLAVQKKDANMIRLLLKYGANINAPNSKGQTPLHVAVNSGSNTMAKILLENGADYKLNDNAGRSAYIYASANKTKDPDTFELLDNVMKNAQQPAMIRQQGMLSQQMNQRVQQQTRPQQKQVYQKGQQVYQKGYQQQQNLRYPQQNIQYQRNGYHGGNTLSSKEQQKMQKRQAIGNVANAFISMFAS